MAAEDAVPQKLLVMKEKVIVMVEQMAAFMMEIKDVRMILCVAVTIVYSLASTIMLRMIAVRNLSPTNQMMLKQNQNQNPRGERL